MPISFPVSINTQAYRFGLQKRVYYPQANQMKNQQLQHFINQSIIQQVQSLISFQVGDMPSTVKEMLGSYEIKNNQRQVLSLTQSNYTYHDRAAHGMTFIRSLTFDLKKGRRCDLKDLFKPGSDYVKRLSDLIHEQIKERKIELISEFTTISPNQEFYIADKTLVIYFQLYDLTPYVFGFPMFPISVYDIQDIIDEDGPLGRMATNN
ncbi:DUF3298 and DUF4163 domain-containing protein [Bacillus sp. REN16]|uniref:DUF3298 and DUF4163 domain-containing protein n=1 Tax=Bacillus sp. REN16 TaxID=2887296 RepID=UPI001E540DAE|nr:DUF3298 and DUF4163 domain-containing protein [Bacillus sp. REN16]MCC3357730.1 DUF3298 and DUF4163 domain-containing protein [Bacillus sp. REN16]